MDNSVKELAPMIGKGYTLHEYLKADLNSDKLGDYILILRNGKKTPQEDEEAEKLLVHLIVREKDNSLRIHSSNHGLLEYIEDGNDNDYIEVDSLGGGFSCHFTFRAMEATAKSSYNELRFRFDKKTRQWNLTELVDESYYDTPMAAITRSIHLERSEGPELTEAQIDSLGKYYEKIYTDKVNRTAKTPKQFGTISFPKANRQLLYTSLSEE
ncbi:hypothetical protein EFA69_15390 [Rufibacter immobilis]|uniref:Uncharacterized protein n=2 Tax=Rufibacter immobilis TaxID=1348778 RepID=A0A3M9MS09_9BACT|nr:hypothetical protein EFA69_15390 [Rufibacter immobilis]